MRTGSAQPAGDQGAARQSQAELAAALACPAKAPAAGRASVTPAGSGQLIRPRPAAAVICQYGGAHVVRQVRFSAAAADGLAAVLDNAVPPARHVLRCTRPAGRLPGRQLIRFSYQSGPAATATAVFGSCQAALVTAAGHQGALLGSVADDLWVYTMMTTGTTRREPAVPDFIGLSAAAATAAARRHGFTAEQDASAVDTRVRPGTVIFQSLPPGARDDSQQVSITIAVPAAPACRPGQLSVSYAGGTLVGGGLDAGMIVFADTSPVPCRLAGPLRLAGLSAAGQRDTKRVRYQVGLPGVLSPLASPGTTLRHPQPGELVGMLTIVAEYRDDASGPNGLCASSHQIVPATWRLTLPSGAAITVPDADPHAHRRPFLPALLTCRGEIYNGGTVQAGEPGA